MDKREIWTHSRPPPTHPCNRMDDVVVGDEIDDDDDDKDGENGPRFGKSGQQRLWSHKEGHQGTLRGVLCNGDDAS